MATLTVVDAARITGVSRSQLYRYIRSGKLSRTPDGLLDTAELLRAGLMLHVPSVPSPVSSPVPETHDATIDHVSPVPEPVPRVPSTDTAPLERLINVLQRELAAARDRETLLTQAAHERETQLLQLLAQMHQQNQRLLDMPRTTALQSPQDAPGATQPPPPAPEASPTTGHARRPARREAAADRGAAAGVPRGAHACGDTGEARGRQEPGGYAARHAQVWAGSNCKFDLQWVDGCHMTLTRLRWLSP
jgi:Helix-turn-helix domain